REHRILGARIPHEQDSLGGHGIGSQAQVDVRPPDQPTLHVRQADDALTCDWTAHRDELVHVRTKLSEHALHSTIARYRTDVDGPVECGQHRHGPPAVVPLWWIDEKGVGSRAG